MAVVATHLTTDSSGTSASSYATASISPTTNRLVLVAVRANNAGSITTPTLSGAGMTWVEVDHIEFASGQANVTLFRSLSASPGSGALTIDFGAATIQQCHWSIVEFSGINTSGTNGSGAIVQNATNFNDGGTSTGITVTLAAFGNVNNATFGAVGYSNTAAITEGSGFTELAENNANSRTIETEFRNDNDTSVDWSWASATPFVGAIAVEIADVSTQTTTSTSTTTSTTSTSSSTSSSTSTSTSTTSTSSSTSTTTSSSSSTSTSTTSTSSSTSTTTSSSSSTSTTSTSTTVTLPYHFTVDDGGKQKELSFTVDHGDFEKA